MKFVALEVENMFAYNGRSRVDLSDCSADKNIIVVSGPNGAGKTSLLNAVKLLFLGHNDEGLRRVGFRGTTLTPKQYVLGQQGRWYGVFNTNAMSSSATAQVSLEWTDGGRSFRARRLYRSRRNGADFDHEVSVTADGTPLVGEDNEAALQQLLPREVVPFFFFDGEQIQSLADAEVGRESAEIERLLGLSFVVHLLGQLDTYIKDRGRAGLPEEVRDRIVAAENGARQERSKAEVAGRSRIVVEDELLDLERQRRRLEEERVRMRGGTLSETERRRILGRIAVLESQRETLADRISETLPPESVFLTQGRLVDEAFRLLDRHVASADTSLAGKLHRELPPRLVSCLESLDRPAPLDETQRDGFELAVHETLEEIGVPKEGPSHPLLSSLSPRRAAALRDRFLVWAQKGGLITADHRDMLLEMRQIASELQRLRRDLDEAELTTDEAKARHEEILAEVARIDAEIRAAIERSAELKIEEQRALREAAAFEDRVTQLEHEHRHVAMQNKRYQLGLKVKRALEEYRDRRRGLIKQSVEDRLNERVRLLLASSQLIRSVRLDVQFHMSYFDELEEEVARHSISAGMRQLLAMAMLWALKDEADRPLPVIVDTPLGRIDRTNRGLLMREYFPKAGNPLVLLPTDTEFGQEGYDVIGDRVRRRYRIENRGGNSARIVEEGRTHGGKPAA